MKSKTFDEFWQVFLQVTFHEGNPLRWSRREQKATWCEEHLGLKKGDWIADLGCGDGILDIWLSRMGFKVSAIDRSKTGIALARSEDDTKAVLFSAQDLREVSFPENSLNGIVILETIGLMNHADDLQLLKNCYRWLKPGGRIATDCPLKPSVKNDWSKEFQDGRVDAKTSFDEATRIHRLNFEFHPKSGEPFNLHDPISPEGGAGITRYIYSQEELTQKLQEAGFRVSSVEHYYGETYFGLIGEK